jgi:3-oxoacyl-[acyl-carrier protein] reductase
VNARRVLVTGASRGIGRAIAVELAAQGFAVTLAYRSSQESAEAALAEARAAGPEEPALLQFDVADRESCTARLEHDLAANGPFWGVVSNAGITADAVFPAMTGDDWDRVLRTNLDGFYNVVRPLVMPMVRARDGGRIVTMSSIAGITGHRGQANYAASKAGLIAATRSLAQELAKRKITVNSVAPGFIETDMIADLSADQIAQLVPLRRLGRPDEVAALVGFLMSDAAAYITSQVISINGGLV